MAIKIEALAQQLVVESADHADELQSIVQDVLANRRALRLRNSVAELYEAREEVSAYLHFERGHSFEALDELFALVRALLSLPSEASEEESDPDYEPSCCSTSTCSSVSYDESGDYDEEDDEESFDEEESWTEVDSSGGASSCSSSTASSCPQQVTRTESSSRSWLFSILSNTLMLLLLVAMFAAVNNTYGVPLLEDA